MKSEKVEEIKSYIIPPQLSYMIHGVDNHPNPFSVDDYSKELSNNSILTTRV